MDMLSTKFSRSVSAAKVADRCRPDKRQLLALDDRLKVAEVLARHVVDVDKLKLDRPSGAGGAMLACLSAKLAASGQKTLFC
jgi:hypothetical protein